MPRRTRKQLKQRNNKGSHQRRRTTRGHRFMSKLEKYKWYGGNTQAGQESDTTARDDISVNN